MQNHHPNSDFIPDINTLLCYLSYHYVTHVTQNILSNASGFVLLDIYPKSVIEDMCLIDLMWKLQINNGLVKETIVSLYNGIQWSQSKLWHRILIDVEKHSFFLNAHIRRWPEHELDFPPSPLAKENSNCLRGLFSLPQTLWKRLSCQMNSFGLFVMSIKRKGILARVRRIFSEGFWESRSELLSVGQRMREEKDF